MSIDPLPHHCWRLKFAIAMVMLGLSPVAVLAQESVAANSETSAQAATALWTSHIQPLLMEHCQKCHGGAKAEAELDLRTPESIARGSVNGPVVLPGNPEESLLLKVIQPSAELVMPPESAGLSEDQRGLIHRWIANLATNSTGTDDSWATAGPEATTPPLKLPPANMSPTVVIDYLINEQWAQNDWQSQPGCDDRTFVRRVHLDLVGRIPTPAEVNRFLGDTQSDKRQRLVDALLDSPEYAEHFADLFDAMLMGRKGHRAMRERSSQGWMDYLQRSFAENQPWNQTVRELALARPTSAEDRGAAWFLFERKDNYQEIAEAISPVMFGVQIQCAQCHDHPLAPEIKQAHYWGLVAFYSRGKNQMTPLGPRIAESAVGAYDQFTDIGGNSYPNRLTFIDVPPIDDQRPADLEAEQDGDDRYVAAAPVDGQTEGLPKVPVFSRRELFVDQVLSDHPRVATAMVNRLWALMMGRGLVHPVDKIDSVHPSRHPVLLAWLARDFREHDYDIRRTLRAIVLSKAYQLETGHPDATLPPDSFAYAIEKPLTAEMIIQSLAVGLYGARREDDLKLRRELVEVFPDVLPEESVTTLKQTLYLSNNPDFNACFRPDDGSLATELIESSDDVQAIFLLFDRLVNRPPTDDEINISLAFLQSRPDRRTEALTHLTWALATSAEFRFNH